MPGTPIITPALLYNGVQMNGPSADGSAGWPLTTNGSGTASFANQLAPASIQAQSSFSSGTGALAAVPTFYAATVGSSYSKALAASASVADGTIISIRIVSLTGTSLLTITPDGSDVIRHCGADLSSIVLARLGAELMLRKRGSGWDVLYIRGRQAQEVFATTPGATTTGYGTSDLFWRRYSVSTTTGQACTFADSAANGSKVTINENGEYKLLISDFIGTSTFTAVSASVDSNQGSTAWSTITAAHKLPLGVFKTSVAFETAMVCGIIQLSVGQVVRAHFGDNTKPNGTSADCLFRILKLGE